MLWIAFKSLYLWYSKQQEKYNVKLDDCCELLSKVYIFDIRNNEVRKRTGRCSVVNCFQKFISLIFETTCRVVQRVGLLLWIAFKSLYLWYSKQQLNWHTGQYVSCELLSKVYIFDIRNNNVIIREQWFQLWIAFKSLYLWYSKQPW